MSLSRIRRGEWERRDCGEKNEEEEGTLMIKWRLKMKKKKSNVWIGMRRSSEPNFLLFLLGAPCNKEGLRSPFLIRVNHRLFLLVACSFGGGYLI